jgi:HSP20 family protein
MHVHLQAWESSFDNLADEMWNMLRDMQSRDYFRSHAPHTWKPRINVYETLTRFLVCVELSGMRPDDIDVQYDEGVLHIRGHRPKPCLPEPEEHECHKGKVGVHLMEIDWGTFHRKLKLNTAIRVDKVAAIYGDGYVWIMLPREGAPSES